MTCVYPELEKIYASQNGFSSLDDAQRMTETAGFSSEDFVYVFSSGTWNPVCFDDDGSFTIIQKTSQQTPAAQRSVGKVTIGL